MKYFSSQHYFLNFIFLSEEKQTKKQTNTHKGYPNQIVLIKYNEKNVF